MRSVVQIHLGPPYLGAVAQLGEHLVCNQGVAGSIPVRSTQNEGTEGLQEAGVDFLHIVEGRERSLAPLIRTPIPVCCFLPPP